MKHENFDLGALPFGFCEQCLDRMRAGRLFEAVELLGGARLVHAYCEHREAGAAMILREDRPQRWSISVPIDALEWRSSVAARAGAYDGLQRAQEGADAKQDVN